MTRRPPIALFVYNRADHAQRTLSALKANAGALETDLFVFSDGPKSDADAEGVRQVRSLVDAIDGFRSVTVQKQDTNIGLASSIIQGVTQVVNDHGRVIVIEDDIVTASGALNFFANALEHYADNLGVFSISAFRPPEKTMPLPADYEYDIFFSPRMLCWGWATWSDRWNRADFSMSDYDRFMASPAETARYKALIGNDSFGTLEACVRRGKDVWACRWVYTHFKHHALCALPAVSYVNNVGLDGSGANCGTEHRFYNELAGPYPQAPSYPVTAFLDDRIFQSMIRVYDPKGRGPNPYLKQPEQPAKPQPSAPPPIPNGQPQDRAASAQGAPAGEPAERNTATAAKQSSPTARPTAKPKRKKGPARKLLRAFKPIKRLFKPTGRSRGAKGSVSAGTAKK